MNSWRFPSHPIPSHPIDSIDFIPINNSSAPAKMYRKQRNATQRNARGLHNGSSAFPLSHGLSIPSDSALTWVPPCSQPVIPDARPGFVRCGVAALWCVCAVQGWSFQGRAVRRWFGHDSAIRWVELSWVESKTDLSLRRDDESKFEMEMEMEMKWKKIAD